MIKEIGDAAVEEPAARVTGQNGAMRHAIEQLRVLTEDSNLYHWKWQTATRDAEALRAQLKYGQGRTARPSSAELAAIRGSRGFRFLQRLYGIRLFLMPHGSRRERLVRRRFSDGAWRGPRPGGSYPPASAAVPVSAAPRRQPAAGRSAGGGQFAAGWTSRRGSGRTSTTGRISPAAGD